MSTTVSRAHTLFDELMPGDRIEVEHTITVGRSSWPAKTYVTVLRTDLRVTAGKPAAYRSNSGEKCDRFGVWRFCRKCGSPLYWESDNGKECDIFAGSLDDPSVFKPEE